jgi:hypothetical protein
MTCPIQDLKPHPAYERLGLFADVVGVSALAAQGDLAFESRVTVTTDLHILHGYELFELARLRKKMEIDCIEICLNQEESLLYLLQQHQGSRAMPKFNRILLAFEPEPSFRLQAKSNQSTAGLPRGSSNLTKTDPVDVRARIAAAAGVSSGTITQAKKVLASAVPIIIQALTRNEIRLYRAYRFGLLPREHQERSYRRYLNERGIIRSVRHLINRHAAPDKGQSAEPHLRSFLEWLKTTKRSDCDSQHLDNLLQQLAELNWEEGCKNA